MKKNREKRRAAAQARAEARKGQPVSLTGMRQEIKAGKLTPDQARERLRGTNLDSPEFITWLERTAWTRYNQPKKEKTDGEA